MHDLQALPIHLGLVPPTHLLMYCNSQSDETLETELPLAYVPNNRWGPLRRKHAWSVFEGEAENTDEHRLSTYIYSDVMEVAIERLIDHLIHNSPDHLRVLIGSTDLFPTRRYPEVTSTRVAPRSSFPGETWRMRTLRHLIKYGSGLTLDCESFEEYQRYIRRTFDRVLIPHNLGDNHYILFEIAYKGLGASYLKVWDSVDLWRNQDPKTIPQILHVLSLFFEVGEKVRVYHKRDEGEPDQGSTAGCAAFCFFTLSHLAQREWPPAATADDEAYIRNYLWGSAVQTEVLALPKRA